MKTAISKINNINQITCLRVIVLTVFLFMFAYLYFVNTTAFSAAAYENISDDIIETQSEIGELELVYIEKTRNIERDLSEEFALVSALDENTVYTKRNIATKLTFNE
jgi:hypothetical protein